MPWRYGYTTTAPLARGRCRIGETVKPRTDTDPLYKDMLPVRGVVERCHKDYSGEYWLTLTLPDGRVGVRAPADQYVRVTKKELGRGA